MEELEDCVAWHAVSDAVDAALAEARFSS